MPRNPDQKVLKHHTRITLSVSQVRAAVERYLGYNPNMLTEFTMTASKEQPQQEWDSYLHLEWIDSEVID